MHRTKSLHRGDTPHPDCLFLLLVGIVAACGGVTVLDRDRAESGSASGSGGASTTTGGAAGGAPDGGGGMCNEPPPPSPTLPNQPGCYVDLGQGWVAVPCVCDFWLENTTHAAMSAAIQLVVTPPEQVPTLTGTLDVEVAFDDPDASWYATWTKQVGNGQAFTVTNDGNTTTVRMGEGAVALAPVTVAACETRKAIAHVSADNYTAELSMKAVIENGSATARTDGRCSNPPPAR